MKKLLYILPLIAILAGCSSSYDLDDSVYVYDEEYKDLPAYTEWGYNTFGAYLDRVVFISDDATPAKILTTDGKTVFVLNGVLRTGYADEMTVKFIIPGFAPAKYSDLVALNDTTITLTDPGCKVTMVRFGDEDTLSIISGELQFKRVQHLIVDNRSTEAILSGYFSLRTFIDSQPVTLSKGRFDVGINNDNFYTL